MERTPLKNEVNEISRLKQIEQELNARLRQQAAIADLGQLALTSNPLSGFMSVTAGMLVDILEVELCNILELLPNGQELLLRAGVGWKEGQVGQVCVSAMPESQVGYILQAKAPVIVTDLQRETRFSSPPLFLEHGIISGMSVVIPGKERLYGILGVHTTRPRIFTTDDINFLVSVANLLAAAIDRERAEEALRSSRNELAVILQSVADGITVQDNQGNLVYANQAAARIIGFNSEKELLSTPVSEILKRFELLDETSQSFPPGQLPGRQVMQGTPEASTTLRFRTVATGDERWAAIKSRPVLNSAGEVEMAVNVFQDITELKRAERNQWLLAEVGNLLEDSLDYSSTLASVAKLCVPYLADWCVVHVMDENENQQVQQIAVTHVDPNKVQMVTDFQHRYPPDLQSQTGLAKVLSTGRPEFYPLISDEFLQASAKSAEHLQVMRELRLRSAIILPLVARGRALGAISLVWAESGRLYTQQDVELAQELARRAALAIDNARLYRQVQQANVDLEQRVSHRTSQLQTIITKLRNEITERQRVEQALRKSETMLAGLFESAPDALILVQGDGKIIRASAQAESMFGYRRDELIQLPVDTLLPQESRGGHSFRRSAFNRTPRTRSMGLGLDLFGLRKDGSQFPIDIMLSPVNTPEGLQIICAIRDITERKRIEAELAEVQRRLIESVEAERLHLSQELHDGPIQELYGLSYQLNWLEDQLNGSSDLDPIREYKTSAAETMQHVISQLREICSELRPPALSAFGLEKAIESHLDKLQAQHSDLRIRTGLTLDGGRLPERVSLALYRIYQHSVSNVLRHSGATELQVNLKFDGKKVTLEVRDNGRGFEIPTRWVELARSGHLGLVGTAERVKAIGGKLQIKSAVGKGTTVRVSVPYTDELEAVA